MAAGFGLLRLAPAVFWSLTPREFETALRFHTGPRAASTRTTRAALDDLIARFPD